MSNPLEDVMGDSSGTGATIAILRKAAGLTQDQLARAANVSKSLLSKVEVGDRAATHALVAAVARALHVPTERVHGQPYGSNGTDAAHSSMDALRAVVRAYDLPPADDIAPRPVDELRRTVGDITQLRRDGRYTTLGQRLPAVLAELSAAQYAAPDGDRRALFGMLAATYYAAHGLSHRLGYADLAESIEHKLIWAAEHAEDPLAVGLANWTRVTPFQAGGHYGHGLHILDRARAGLLASTADQADPATVTVLGSIHLRAADIASRAGDAAEVRAHFTAAERLTAGRPSDQRHYQLNFGPANLRIHQVAAAVELGQPHEAVRLVEDWQPPADLAATRVGHHYIDLARAHLAAGDRHAALLDLHRARAAAPEQTRYHPMVRETARVLISLHRRADPDLTRLAAFLGMVA